MVFFEKERLKILSEEDQTDLSRAAMNKNLSFVEFDSQSKYFYITIDKVLFSNPIATIKSVLDSQGFVTNLENILFCLDSLEICVRAKLTDKSDGDPQISKVNEFLPCLRFELPQKNKVGEVLQSFYDVIANYEEKLSGSKKPTKPLTTEFLSQKDLTKENQRLKNANKELALQVSQLTEQLLQEKKSLSQASKALDTQEALPGNTKICRVEHVDLKKRIIKVKSFRKIIEIPTHMLDRVPDFKARCLITFDEDEKVPLGVLFFDNQELNNIEKRTADLLYVEGDTFKARDSMRNEFQIKAVNDLEESTIQTLKRGMQVLISVADGYVVRFSVINSESNNTFQHKVNEQFVVFEIGRNQLESFKIYDDDNPEVES